MGHGTQFGALLSSSGYKYLSDFCDPYLFVLMTMRMIEEEVEGWDSFLSPTCKKAVKGVQWRGGTVVIEGVEDVGSLVRKMQWGRMSYHATDGGWARHVSGHGGGVCRLLGVWQECRACRRCGWVIKGGGEVEIMRDGAYWLLSADRVHRKALEVAEQAMVANGSCEALGLREWLAGKYGGLRWTEGARGSSGGSEHDNVGERCDAWEGSSRGSVNADVRIFRSRILLEFHIRIPHGTFRAELGGGLTRSAHFDADYIIRDVPAFNGNKNGERSQRWRDIEHGNGLPVTWSTVAHVVALSILQRIFIMFII
ncbi:hypothetical protein F5887DRAFT_924104 [Amanita rubescens]|nr:hypothetical protein F5887DRAFT_924104 [Amanita rubescens]